MAIFQITMVTLSAGIPHGDDSYTNRHAPWSGTSDPFTLQDARIDLVSVEDDDAGFNSTYYQPEDMQRLVGRTTFGTGDHAVTLPAGSQLSLFTASHIIDDHVPPNRFVAVFPQDTTTDGIGQVVGGRTSVLILPVPHIDMGSGKSIVPIFDPQATFIYDGVRPLTSQDTGVAYQPTPETETGVTCFAAGTLIETDTGARAIEDLSRGCLIRTRDHGLRAVRWVGSTRLDADRLDLQPNLRPVRISAGALGPGQPARDLVVSPQHRVLVRSAIAQRMFGQNEVLVAAKHLLGLPGIRVMNPSQGITYLHLLFDHHEIVRSDGAWTESLFTGPHALWSMGAAARREILSLFPELACQQTVRTGARRLLTGHEGRKLAARHAKNARRLFQDA